MRRNAFTLVELLVVVAIVALLLAILMPGVSAGRSMAKAAVCRHNLGQLGKAFVAAARVGPRGTVATAYPRATDWPDVPMDVAPDPGIYICPEESVTIPRLSDYAMHSQAGFLVPFEPGEYRVSHCMILTQGPGWADYGFEDLVFPGSDYDYNDVVIRIIEGPPKKGVIMSTSAGYANSLYFQGELVPGFEDFRNCIGKEFKIFGGETNYGINSQVQRYQLTSNTIVLLDYDQLIANNNEDMGLHLRKSARHRGKVNFLSADGSVSAKGPTELEVDTELWWP